MSKSSVFLRLGPRAPETKEEHASKTGSDALGGLLKGLTTLDDELAKVKQRKDTAPQNRKPNDPPPRKKHENQPTKRVEQPSARLLQRTLHDMNRGRSAEGPTTTTSLASRLSVPPSATGPASTAQTKEMQEQLRKLEDERKAAQELADALLLQQQALMEEKQRVQRENMALQTEKQNLLERLTYLECDEGELDDMGSPYMGGNYYPGEGTDRDDSPLHDLHLSGMKHLQLDGDDDDDDDDDGYPYHFSGEEGEEEAGGLNALALDKLQLDD